MPTSAHDSTWDFSPVLNLLNSLSHKDAAAGKGNESPTPSKQKAVAVNKKDIHDGINESLGNFERVWDFLGVQRNIPPPTVPPFETVTAAQNIDKDAYASDGAIYYPPSSKSVKWRDEEEGIDLTDIQAESPPDRNGLTKSQRKKRNRKARRAAEWAAQADRLEKKRLSRETRGSGDESEGSPPASVPARIASVHLVAPQLATKRPEVLSQYDSKINTEGVTAESKIKAAVEAVSAVLQQPMSGSHTQNGNTLPSTPKASKVKPTGGLLPAQLTPSLPQHWMSTSPTGVVVKPSEKSAAQHLLPLTPNRPPLATIHDSLQKQWPVADPFAARSLSSSAQVFPTQHKSSIAVSSNKMAQTPTPTPTHNRRYEIVPLNFNNPVDRNWSLLLKLINNFPEDRAHLLSPLQLSINRAIPNGIHVFVDASNIIIGFHDTLKRVRNIPQYARVPRVNLNFHALALLLERRRPVTKRVVAGSMPEIPAFEEARQVGYETNILDKVFKARELTEKQRRIALREATGRNGYHSGSDSAGNRFPSGAVFPMDGNSDASERALPPQQPKWVEQAVDEVLHLKILESIIDTPVPTVTPNGGVDQAPQTTTGPPSTAPTMILATGDAAEAEYSPGFMRMVQRALGKGWNVEVVAWSKSVSMDYRKMERSAALGDRFKIIELDDYAEELFGAAVEM